MRVLTDLKEGPGGYRIMGLEVGGRHGPENALVIREYYKLSAIYIWQEVSYPGLNGQ